MSEQFIDVGGGITLCYERFGDPADPPVLLVMGLATQMIAWHEDFCAELVGRGFHVVRFDNRDIGRSTHVDSRPPSNREMLLRRTPPGQYTVSDMAEDTAGLMRKLEIAPAHVVGASMGGMIGQMLAAEHPELVRSLTSLMSNTGSRITGQPSPAVLRYLLKAPPRSREEVVERAAAVFGVVGSKGLHDEQQIREVAGLSYDRGHDMRGPGRQLGAIIASGNRASELHRIKAPTLVIHGTNDKLIRTSGGRATAKAIPGAKLMLIDGMGHDLPRPLWPQLIDAIAGHAHAADAAAMARRAGARPGARARS
ncbi:MAG: alpha/beta fold hydrolase [Actinomycetota bacterium]|nr:alpha/beta fold hydrolase [Actinomycetota bacterium]